MSKPLLRRSIFRVFALATLAMLVAVAVLFWSRIDNVQHPLKSDRWFTQQQLGSTNDLYDLGVVDVNSDNWFDLFTVNHSARQSLLVRDASGGFTDSLIQLALSQNPKFPGVEPSDIEPPIKTTGLYIYWHKAELVIRAHNLEDTDSATGKIQLADWVVPESVIAQTKGNLDVTTDESENNLIIEFAAQGNSQLILSSTQYTSVDCSFELNEKLPLDQVYVGPEKIKPNSHQFKLVAGKDRHGMAWADFQGDKQLDVFIVRGGGAGRMRLNSPGDKDELLFRDGFSFKDRTATSGILKKTCPARQVASVDFNNDGKLDIYVVCGRDKPPRQFFPNQLYLQRAQGRFVEVALERGLDIPQPGSFVWLDAEKDGDMDLLWASDNQARDNQEFWLYVNHAGQFKPQLIGQSEGKINQLTVSDYDLDGDLDLFAASSKENVLLTSFNGTYKITEPKSWGLPTQASSANWVDYDNDGLMDLHVFPGGIYRQRSDHRFEATHLLESKLPLPKSSAPGLTSIMMEIEIF